MLTFPASTNFPSISLILQAIKRHQLQAIRQGDFNFFADAPTPSMDAQTLVRALLKVDPRRPEVLLMDIWNDEKDDI